MTGIAGENTLTEIVTPVSFNVPLETAPKEVSFVQIKQKGGGPNGTVLAGKGCPESSEAAKPEAEAGYLCVFVTEETNVVAHENFKYLSLSPEKADEFFAVGKTGTDLLIGTNTTEPAYATGTWAVTAE